MRWLEIISTHTSLAGRDIVVGSEFRTSSISTHTSLAGRDEISVVILLSHEAFLLTRPSRDVTGKAGYYTRVWTISTHTSLAGRDEWNLIF